MIRLGILDVFKKTNVNHWYKYYYSLLALSRNEIKKIQSDQLKNLINHAYNHVDYYTKIFHDLKITPRDIKSTEDLKALPILDRKDIQENLNVLISKAYNRNVLLRGSSSGTTGTPINYYQSKDGYSAGAASAYILWGMSGWKPGNSLAHIWGNSTSIERWKTPQSRIKSKIFNQLNIAATDLYTTKGIIESVQKIAKFNPETLEGYVSSIYSLALYLKENGLSLNKVKRVFTTAENLGPLQREIIEEYIGPTSDLYGCGEILGIAIRPINTEKHYVFDPHVLVEAIESDIPGMKHLLITDLNNFGMPLIRYKVGDMIDGLFEPEDNDKVPFTYFKKIMGRSTDIISLPNGNYLHPVSIFGGTLFRKYKQITRHKVIWNGEKLIFVFECSQKFDDSELKSEISGLLKTYEVPFEITFVSKILPSSSGKYKYLEITNN